MKKEKSDLEKLLAMEVEPFPQDMWEPPKEKTDLIMYSGKFNDDGTNPAMWAALVEIESRKKK